MRSDEPIKKYMTAQTHTVGDSSSILDAEAIMQEHAVRHLPVLHGGRLVGILSDRDIVASRRFDNKAPENLPVEEACTQEVYTVGPDTSLKECVKHMAEHHIGCTIISEDSKVLGIFTTTDACRLLAQRL